MVIRTLSLSLSLFFWGRSDILWIKVPCFCHAFLCTLLQDVSCENEQSSRVIGGMDGGTMSALSEHVL